MSGCRGNLLLFIRVSLPEREYVRVTETTGKFHQRSAYPRFSDIPGRLLFCAVIQTA